MIPFLHSFFFFHRSCAAIPLSYTIFTILYDFPAMRYVFFPISTPIRERGRPPGVEGKYCKRRFMNSLLRFHTIDSLIHMRSSHSISVARLVASYSLDACLYPSHELQSLSLAICLPFPFSA